MMKLHGFHITRNRKEIEDVRISFEESDGNMIFRISDFERKYEDVLKMCFYQQDGASYIKRFPIQTKYLEKIMAHYSKNAQHMFDQLGYFKPIPWERALFEFVKQLDGTDIDWWLTGSCAACIRGIPFQPHDVDIMIAAKDVDALSDLFSDYLIEPIIDTKGWLTKDFGVLFLHARIDIASDPHESLDQPEPVDCGPYAREHVEECQWHGYTIKVPPIQLQLNVNRRRGRTERVKLIEEYLNK
ncbi:MAG: hypothetical protein RBT80_09140 [Candidatus Vecturithrix sp.]|nr:hypothetical protein [Candidatus Vecturithrix sp.]